MSLGLSLALVLALRLVAILFLKPGGSLIDSIGDLGFYRELGELTLGGRLPYRDFWVEYPPVFPFVLTLIYRLSIEIPGWPSTVAPFQALLSLFLLACDVANVLLVRRIAGRVHGPAAADRAALLYAPQPFLVLCGLAWFDPFPVAFMLLGLDAALAGRGALAGAALALGGLTKLIPLVVGPAVVRALATRRQLLAAAVGGALATLAVVLPLVWLDSPFVAASLRATLVRSSWESVWALLEGYWWVGTVAPVAERLVLATAGRPLHESTLPWTLIVGLNLILMLLLCLAPAGPRRPRAVLAVAGLGLYLTLLLSRGYSPQFLVYQLPLLILLWPDRRGVAYALALTGLGLLEWPIVLSLFPDRRDLIALVIGLRTLVWIWLVVEMALELLPDRALARARAGGRLVTGGAVAVGVLLLGVGMARLLPARGEHVPVLTHVAALSDAGPVVASSRAAFYRLVPALGADRATLGAGALAAEVSERVRAGGGGDFWLVLDHSEGEPEARARLERELGALGSRATDRWFGFYHLIGFLRPEVWRADGRLVAAAVPFGDSLTLVGWGTSAAAVEPGRPLRLVLAWQVRRRPPADFKAFVHLLGPTDETILGQEDRPLDFLGRGASAWSDDEAPLTALDPLVPAGTRPGTLRLRIGLYDGATGARLPVGGADHLDLPGPTVVAP